MNLNSTPIEPSFVNAKKLCADDFDKAIFEKNKHLDKIVLVSHPVAHKNFGLTEEYDAVANLFKGNNKKLQIYEMNGVNENKAFKVPTKLPAVLFFRQGMHLDEQPVQLDRFKLLQSIGEDQKVKRSHLATTLNEFVK